MRTSTIKRAAGAAIALAVFAFLFVRTLEDTRSTPYTLERADLQNWRVVLVDGRAPTDPVLVLAPPGGLAPRLFQQVFSRAMESLSTPPVEGIPIVLKGEFDSALSGQLTASGLLEAAEQASIGTAGLEPVCMVHRRVSTPGATRQVFFALFDAPALERFRAQLGLDSGGWSPVMLVAGAGADLHSWLPIRVDAEQDCDAPLSAAG